MKENSMKKNTDYKKERKSKQPALPSFYSKGEMGLRQHKQFSRENLSLEFADQWYMLRAHVNN